MVENRIIQLKDRLINNALTESFPSGSAVKNPLAKTGDAVLIPGLEIFPGGRNGNPLQYSSLENPMDRGG